MVYDCLTLEYNFLKAFSPSDLETQFSHFNPHDLSNLSCKPSLVKQLLHEAEITINLGISYLIQVLATLIKPK